MSSAREEAISFVQRCMAVRPETIQEYSFLELAEPTIEAGYQRCVARGATSIVAIPVLLLTAAHAKKDIPEILSVLHGQFPEVKLRYGQPIGIHQNMVDIAAERILQTNQPVTDNSLILLVGRGSSDPEVKRDLQEIGRRLSHQLHGIRVEDCYLTAAKPSFQKMMELPLPAGADRVFIMPYFLFTGILMKGIANTVGSVAVPPKCNYVLCSHLGYDSKIEAVLTERIDESQTLPSSV